MDAWNARAREQACREEEGHNGEEGADLKLKLTFIAAGCALAGDLQLPRGEDLEPAHGVAIAAARAAARHLDVVSALLQAAYLAHLLVGEHRRAALPVCCALGRRHL